MSEDNSRISTGSFDLTNWLEGGYEKDIITMIVGPPASGKTNIAILVACAQAKNNKVLFVDSEGGFSIERVKQISGNSYEKVLENILLLKPVSFNEQIEAFEKIYKKIKKEQISMIVIDGMAMLYRLELMSAIKTKDNELIREVNGEVARQMMMLAEIARKQKIPVLITNQVYTNFVEGENWNENKSVNIVGGDLLQYWSKCIIELRKNKDKRTAILLKHRSLAEKQMDFEIKEKGIFKKSSWI